jgi:circadian clock protein KaiC
LKEVVKLLINELRNRKVTLLVIDGFAIANAAFTVIEIKEFIHELQLAGEACGCTSVIVTAGVSRGYQPEETMVDGIICLHRTLHGTRSLREAEVLKMRGSFAVLGRHSFAITHRGITVYPRLEALVGDPNAIPAPEHDLIETGLPPLNHMLGGGLPRGSTTMLLGPSGIGKTSLGLHFLSQSTVQEPGLVFGFYEGPARLAEKAKNFGLPFQKLVNAGALQALCFPPTEQLLDDLGAQLLKALSERGIKRLFIDGYDGFEQATPNRDRVGRFFVALANELRIRGVTALFTVETRHTVGLRVDTLTGASASAENIILMRWFQSGARLHRLLSILKVRDSETDLSLHEFRIRNRGIEIDDGSAGAEALLAGTIDRDGGHP